MILSIGQKTALSGFVRKVEMHSCDGTGAGLDLSLGYHYLLRYVFQSSEFAAVKISFILICCL